MAFPQTAVAAPRQSANHRVTSPAFAVAEAVQEAAVRGTLAIGLAGIAVIHAVDSVGKWTESRYMFWMYIGPSRSVSPRWSSRVSSSRSASPA